MYGRILVPVDGSETSNRGLEEAIKLAKVMGGTLRLVHVVNELILDAGYSLGAYSADVFELLRTGGQALLDRAQGAVQRQDVIPECVLLESIGVPAADFILAQAKEWPADLIVMGTHGRRGLRRFAMGSDAEQVLRAASVPVLLVRAQS